MVDAVSLVDSEYVDFFLYLKNLYMSLIIYYDISWASSYMFVVNITVNSFEKEKRR